MKKKWICLALLAMLIGLLSGCSIRTINELYCVPKRSESYMNLQSEIDKVMQGLEYSAPVAGENRKTVQMKDLDGDGEDEFLLFAKGSSEKPLQIFIFAGDGEEYHLVDTIESTGTAVEQVEYVRMDSTGGYELVVGRQVSDQVLRSVSVYSMIDGQMTQLMNANYSKFVCADLNGDRHSELLILRPGSDSTENGVAELYGFSDEVLERSNEINMSEPVDSIKRIMISKLNDEIPAVYVASDVNGSAIITDVFAIVNDQFTNVSFSNESGTSVQTLRNYYVYADDIDDDGILELPDLITMQATLNSQNTGNQYLIRWYAMTSTGEEVDKMYTYHNFVDGWYLQLDSATALRMNVVQQGSSYEFSIWNEEQKAMDKLMTIYALTGQNREEQAQVNNRFVLYRTESTVYASDLEVASATYGITKEALLNGFHLILQDWYTGET